ncbi:MAG TPA: hypothetical protein VH540_17530 [Ktedonobacterales bacterium]|jgi:hypothetical protein
MNRADHHKEHQIADLVAACTSYWALRGVARESRQEMQLELEQHLQLAVADGKSLSRVLGPQPLAFAEAWARARHPRFWRGGITVWPFLVYALSVVSSTALIGHLLGHTSSFPFTWLAAFLLVGSGGLSLLLQLSGFLALRIRTRKARQGLILGSGALAALTLRVAGVQVNWSMTLLRWSWPLTAVLLALAGGLFILECWRATHREQHSSLRPMLLVRSMLPFVSNVALFDAFLFVASMAVVAFCRLPIRLM